MSWLLIVQPDSVQADLLREALRTHVSKDVVVADSLDNALSSIDQCIPDIVLLPALIPGDVEDYVISYLGAIPAAKHVQILGIPVFEGPEQPVPPRARSLMPWRQRQRQEPVTPGCDPGTFTQDVIGYLSAVRTLKNENALQRARAVSTEGPERRTEPRFSRHKVPWISITRFGPGRAALVNVSSRGVLLRTQTRPEHYSLKRSERNVRDQSHLTLELSGNEIHAMGRVVRCVPLRTGAGIQYEIAFSFDDSVGLHLPADALVPAADTKHL